jgi:hypothetical protein
VEAERIVRRGRPEAAPEEDGGKGEKERELGGKMEREEGGEGGVA